MCLFFFMPSRYQKVCKPFGEQTSSRVAKISSIGIAILGATIAIPQLILNGIHTKLTARPRVFGTECTISDHFTDSIWPLAYAGFMMLVFLGTCIPLIVFYVLIGIQAWRHSTTHGIHVSPKKSLTSTENTLSSTLESENESNRKSHRPSRLPRCLQRQQSYDISKCEDSGQKKSLPVQDVKESSSAKTTSEMELLHLNTVPPASSNIDSNNVDNYTSMRMMRRPTLDKSHVNMPMLHELNNKLGLTSIQRSKSKEVEEEEEKHPKESEDQENIMEVSQQGSTLNSGLSNQPDSKTEESTTASEFQLSMQWIDITYCLKENFKEKTGDQESEISGDKMDGKKHSLSTRVARDTSLRQKLSDTLKRAKKAKKEIVVDESQRNRTGSKITEVEYSEKKASNSDKAHHIQFNTNIRADSSDSECDNKSKKKELRKRRKKSASRKVSKTKDQTQRKVFTTTTLKLIIISVIFVAAFVPHLVVITCKFAITNFLEDMTDAGYAVYNIFLRFFFLNSAANAIVYSICDVRFRMEIKKLFSVSK